MTRVVLLFAIAFVTFVLGISTHKVVLLFTVGSPTQEPMLSAAELREEEWHQLYEAVMASGDEALRTEMFMRSMCMGPDYTLDARLVEGDGTSYCVKREGVSDVRVGRLPGHFERALHDAHLKWTLRNFSFLNKVRTQQEARAYVAKRAW